MMTATAFWNSSFIEHVLQEISSTCVDSMPRGIEAQATKTLAVASKQGYSDFVCMSLQT